ncbi:hypothetical protein RRG08_037610 [Elysia crispata]|uniref:Uncharacterized protein n=1 Tax=Elysia crispata TaxID=231223 RepID=A0AAE1CYI1_9GAST|nr:hypothetical protein RRG08_037610 [Elysia crispata]
MIVIDGGKKAAVKVRSCEIVGKSIKSNQLVLQSQTTGNSEPGNGAELGAVSDRTRDSGVRGVFLPVCLHLLYFLAEHRMRYGDTCIISHTTTELASIFFQLMPYSKQAALTCQTVMAYVLELIK